MRRRLILHRALSGSLLWCSGCALRHLARVGPGALDRWLQLGFLACLGIAIGVVWSFITWVLWD